MVDGEEHGAGRHALGVENLDAPEIPAEQKAHEAVDGEGHDFVQDSHRGALSLLGPQREAIAELGGVTQLGRSGAVRGARPQPRQITAQKCR